MDRPAVLIVDDMEVNRDILSFYFRKEYTVLEAADGEEAIDTIKKYTDRIALVFLDFYMPGKSGLDVLSFMQTDNYNIPVIMVTGEPDNELEKQAFALGAADIIYKPFDPDVVYGLDYTGLVAIRLFRNGMRPFCSENPAVSHINKIIKEMLNIYNFY